ncbi:CHAP domain-containing protein [Amycolatopsis sp. NPDC059657]|uniref:CHAP domain-containing protein n=1 Tax=Amycolatopsis sp. NPDC059657 TaxID=3346899 RepID=UPI003671B234
MALTTENLLSRIVKPAAVAALAVSALAIAPVAGATPQASGITAADINPAAATFTTEGEFSVQGAGDGTPAGAIQWFKNHMGSTAWQHYCEKAVENAYGTTAVWGSANAHWNGASPKHTDGSRPPAGAFVYWNISQWGHVGIADGNGGIYATSIGGKIGHASSVNYFNNYRGWTPAARPHQ